MPCLRLADDQLVWDSLGIFEWLHERVPGAVWPADSVARAFARCITAEMHAGFPDVRAHMPMNLKMRLVGASLPAAAAAAGSDLAHPQTPVAALPERVQLQFTRIVTVWTTARERFGAPSGRGPFLFGAFGAADAMYAPVVARFVSYNVDLSAWPLALAYAAAILNHAHFRAWVAAALAETNPINHYDEAALRLGGGAVRDWPCPAEAMAQAAAASEQ